MEKPIETIGIPKYLVCRLQRVQNMAARIDTLTRRYDSITQMIRLPEITTDLRQAKTKYFNDLFCETTKEKGM